MFGSMPELSFVAWRTMTSMLTAAAAGAWFGAEDAAGDPKPQAFAERAACGPIVTDCVRASSAAALWAARPSAKQRAHKGLGRTLWAIRSPKCLNPGIRCESFILIL